MKRNVCVNFTDCDKILHNQIENFWSIEGCGMRAHCGASGEEVEFSTEGMSKEDEHAQRILDEMFTMKDGHYETGLLRKADDIVLPDNKNKPRSG